MGTIVKVSYILWKGNSKTRHLAYFKNRKAADDFVESLDEAEDIQLTEGLQLRDVEPV